MTRDPYASLKQGLVGAWIPSISGSGLLLPDLSMRGNNGVLTGMDASDWVASGSGRALDFDRVDDWVPTTLPGVVTTNRSVSVWFRTTVNLTNGQYATLVRWGTATTFPADIGKDFQVLFGTDDNFGTNGIGISQYGDGVAVAGFNDGQWHHGYFESKGSVYSIYIDGTFRTSKTMTTNAEPGTVRLGANAAGSLLYLGQLDDVRIYNRILTEAEIKLLASDRGIGFKRRASSTFAKRYTYQPPKAKVFEGVRVRDHDYASLRQGLVGAWCPSLPNGGSGNILPDQSGRGNNGTLTNMSAGAWVASGSGRALDFDGVDDHTVASLRYYGTGLVCFWVKQNTDTVSTTFCFGSTASTVERFIIGLGNGFTGTLTNELITVASVNSSGTTRIEGYTTATRTEVFDGRWHHIAIAQRAVNTSYEIYLDGLLRTTTVGDPTLTAFGIGRPGSDVVVIGAQRINAVVSDFFAGQLDDIRIYNRALTESEIRLLASKRGIGLQPSPTKFIAKEKKTGLRRILMTGQT